ncbi:MAG: acyl-CoA dehydrogenase [Saprospiraceae bacterium]|nr:acyl-CoA dehydrogenase family protein [Bacteroidia bacterium]NND06426.1 acyl-CoA dehydrogenase [Saprospiraceae bacterium]
MSKGIENSELEMIVDAINDFASENLPESKLLELDHNDEFPIKEIRQMCGEGLGIHLIFIPEKYEGMGGGAYDSYKVCEAMARIDLGVATGVFATFLGADPIVFGATEEQKKKWLTQIAMEGLLLAYGATEPDAGSDLGNLKTTATPVIEDGNIIGYKLNGSKQWISNGGYADMYTILARAPKGPTWFVLEKGAEGFSYGKPEDKHGIRTSNTAPLSLEDVFVPVENLVGDEEGKGLIQAQLVFGYTRLMVAAFGLGGGWGALDRAIPYSTERIQKGSPLSEKQGYTHKLIVPNVARLEAARSYIEETAERIDNEEGNLNTEGAIAKYMATEAGNLAADDSIQAFGGYGYTKEYMVEKHKRDVRITTIYEGTSEIMEMTISRDRWQLHLKSRGQYYHDRAKGMETLHAKNPNVGADIAAITLHTLAELLEHARLRRLTRNQHILLRIGEWIAWAECAESMARKAERAANGSLHVKADKRFDANAMGAISRIYAREAAMKVGQDGLKWILGADKLEPAEVAAFEKRLNLTKIYQTQSNQLQDMDMLCDVLYDRKVEEVMELQTSL